MLDPDDTIAAIGTASGGSPRGMVRLSGPRVLDCLDRCFRSSDSGIQPRDARLSCVLAGSVTLTGDDPLELPCDLFLWPNQRSYTRQPTAELHTLGSPPLLEKLLRTVCDCGVRLAEPGEFTLRAFLAGRLDLTQAEAVLGVIDAHSSDDLHTALGQLAGGLSQPLLQLREELLQLLAELEAGLDFVEEDIEFITADQLRYQLAAAQAIVANVGSQLESREDAIDLPRVVLSGLPNAGKSSLFNALVERYSATSSDQQALVSEQSGTTRDFVTAVIILNGFACELVDTAGLVANLENHSIDQIAQKISGQQRKQASLVVRCADATVGEVVDGASEEILVRTKSDLLATPPSDAASQVVCSSVDGSGLDHLARQIYERLTEALRVTSNPVALTATRCAESLRQAEASLTQALQIVEVHGGEELIAVEVRSALHALGQVVGAVYTDDILDRIFGQFCIGK
ncbi:MAG: tRNA uridine-5-carboxymethylaminomethyl(34) synthesis GTPase MnmE [Planctomycetes bacterium]|nr:tRNA uridine-5-carboxymethylaminomethyl(34) synthesis GTPase MnmE [Planctomycetota bacterium]